MKVYIGNQEVDTNIFKSAKNIELIKYLADDSECTEIILDNALRDVKTQDLGACASLIRSKMRNGCKLLINDLDFDLLCFFYQKSNDLNEANKILIPSNTLLNIDLVIALFQSVGLELISKNINGLNFILEFRRAV